VSRTDELIRAMLVTGFPYDVHERLEEALRLFNRFIGLARAIRRDGAAALDICYVAAGRMDGFWEERLKPWDALAAALVLEEAGGRVSRFDGAPLELTTDEVLATNGKVHEAMLRVIAEDRAAQTREAQDVLA
jgi:myo-inositol-1(or 4)-monophosphatase